MFRNKTEEDSKYDGLKVKFLYSYEHMNDPRSHEQLDKGYTDYFELYDMYTERIDIEKHEPVWLHIDN